MESLIGIAKFLFAVLALPAVIALTMSFSQVLDKFSSFGAEFKIGILAYVVVHFFILPLKLVHDLGQKLLALIFRFSPFLSKMVPLLVPILPVGCLLGFWGAAGNRWPGTVYWAFFSGIATAMHLIFTAQELREEDSNAIKPNYFFLMTLVYIVNVSLVAVALSMVSKSVSVGDFFSGAAINAKNIYIAAVRQLL